MNEIWFSHSPEETLALARRFAARLKGGGSVGLQGDLGAGKTCFAKGVIAELSGIDPEEVTSPTFTLVEEYRAAGPVFHVDLYRMERPREAEDLPWDEMLGPGTITLIEWPERAPKVIAYCQFRLLFSKEGKNERRIELMEGKARDLD